MIRYLLPLAVIACGGINPDNVPDQPLQGEIGGSAWTSNGSSVVLEGDTIDIDLNDQGIDCENFVGGNEVFFIADNAVGTTELQLNLFDLNAARTVTFFEPEGNVNTIATDGFYAITDIRADEIDLVMSVDGGAGNFLEGRATLPICVGN